MTYSARARAFAELHQPGTPLVLYNIWDAGSAAALSKAGAQALATGSWSVAAAQGYGDGEDIPLELLLQIATRITATSDLPLTVDFEGGFAQQPEALTQNAQKLVETGSVGINFEDQIIGGSGLYGVEEQSRRIAAMRAANGDYFINARTDLFLKEPEAGKHADLVEEALTRAAAYAAAGASGFFIPGLTDVDLIARITAASPLPVNVMMRGGLTLSAVAEAGVARASYGPGPYAKAMKQLGEAFAALT
ncbi:isocitrate lyase/phosphoenolpyruvate mutase family protein [Pseudophaeobacter sp. EL27]|uniref:isocitrate lyase/PEP mutase family protein n=1 Tax=Pseudophaeobacter sp. EL27 TaxID=2107580 RepID=UPI000EFB259F|nr:isocitrate lyase/phosphoenolpyruvate mutase family protein [Pseudophaeobacter sp. EL27]